MKTATDNPINNNLLKQSLEDYLACFENLSINNLAEDLTPRWHPQIEFKDPFNHVFDAQHCERIFLHMFSQCYEPEFKIINVYFDENQGSAYWQFSFKLSPNANQLETIIGNSLIQLDETGLITKHIDFWDAAEYFYEKLPLLGSLIRLVKRKLTVA
ncbi:hypothetical protein [Thiomicrorhabdus sediminis]|uniref:SnoaL-like domain-containing protein n=1 Tax=Thiomicrorhabdus sediminis TaxID=2580412 RepID=A0A4P9K4X6_9GAMM|nr:hypothetical protein [Thiomicrorhabdus sediminis]QCU89908.1 hypothetical protein FE785_04285 [Thiomicrorhabdus sediminis]